MSESSEIMQKRTQTQTQTRHMRASNQDNSGDREGGRTGESRQAAQRAATAPLLSSSADSAPPLCRSAGPGGMSATMKMMAESSAAPL